MKGALSALVLLVTFWAARACAEEPVRIPDPGLKAAIEEQLWVSDPTPTDMLELLHLEAQARSISDLTGLGYAKNLQGLSLRFNHVGDVSPLSGLKNLTSLHLNDNEVGDVSPLGGLTNLRTLDLHDNQISDISALSGLVNVTSLALRENPLSDISPLASLTSLAELSLLETPVSDISALAGLTSLRYVDLRDCPLNDEAYDIYLPAIRENNPGVEIELDPHRGRMLTLSSTFGGSVVEPGEGEFLYPFDTLVHLKAVADPGFVFAGWTGPWPILQSSADIFMERDYEFRAHFVSLEETLYVDNAPADPNADGTAEHPLQSIQDAINVAGEEVTIIVRPGLYRQNINLLGKKIYLTAIDPADPDSGPCAIIEGTGGGPVVLIGSGGGRKCGLSGFVITRGRGSIVGGVYCSGSHPTLSHCLIVGNRCTDPNGAAMYFSGSRAVVTHCTIADNYAGPNGAGLILKDSNITMLDSIVWNNRPDEIRCRDESGPSILYCCVRGWWPDIGNTHTDPLFAGPGVWVSQDDSSVIVASSDPHAVWMDGDYHLKSQTGRWDPRMGMWLQDNATSLAVDAGDPSSEIGFEPSPNGNRVNMGAYGGTTEASRSR